MKKIIFYCFITLCVHQFAISQTIFDITLSKTEIYQSKYPELQKLYIPTNFSLANFDETNLKIDFTKIEILSWDLVYTQYPKGINHAALNQRRLNWLQERLPLAFKIPKHQTNIIEQTQGNTKEKATALFHGFVLYYRNKPTKEDAVKEIASLKKLVADAEKTSINIKIRTEIATTLAPVEMKRSETESIAKSTDTSWPFDRLSSYAYTCKDGSNQDYFYKQYKKVVIMSKSEIKKRGLFVNEAVYIKCDSFIVGYGDALPAIKSSISFEPRLISSNKEDSLISTIWERNKWSNSIVCTDVTGSMYPYTAQLLVWLKLKTGTNHLKSFYFFNDGNNQADSRKIIGNTGGIYPIASDNFEKVSNIMYAAMSAGSGGDAPENNVECVLIAQEANPKAKEIIMIADNWAPVKDLELADKIKTPVRIIVCGSYGNIHPDYLSLAYITKGSVHTIEKDILDLMKFRNGDVFKFNNISYKIMGTKFIKMDNPAKLSSTL